MSVRNKPNYGIFPIDLTTAGQMDMPIIGTRVAMVTAISGPTYAFVAGTKILAGGTVAPNTKISVDDAFEFVRFSWAAQNGVTAFMLVDDDRAGAGVFIDSPSPILGGSVSINNLVLPPSN